MCGSVPCRERGRTDSLAAAKIPPPQTDFKEGVKEQELPFSFPKYFSMQTTGY